MSGPGRFGAVLTAMTTPFDAEGKLDLDGAQVLAKWLVAQGNDGLVVAGTTGESPSLSHEEKRDLWTAVAEAVDVPVIAGSTMSSTCDSVGLTEIASACGVDAILAVTPYYNRPSQAGIEAHFLAVAGATDLPVMLYDIPVRTGRKIEHPTLVKLLGEVENIVALKDAAGSPAASASVVAEVGGFDLYSGDDAMTLPLLAVGACGVVGVATAWCARQTGEMCKAFWAGDIDRARTMNQALIPSWQFETGEVAPNPVPTKAMLRTLGLPAGEPRLPMGPTPAGLEDEARAVYAALVARYGGHA